MRVVLIPNRFPAASETFIASLFGRLLERGWDVHVECAEHDPADWVFFPELDGAHERVHKAWPRKPLSLVALLVPFALIRCLVRAPRRTLRYLTRGVRVYGVKVLWHLYVDAELILLGPDLVHFQFGVHAIGREHVGQLLRCAFVPGFMGADLNFAGLEKEPGYYAKVWKNADGIHFLGNDLRTRAMRRGFTPDGRDMVIKPGVDASRFQPTERASRNGAPLRIVSVGRLNWKKGYEYGLDAVRRLRDSGVACEYRIIGGGEFREGAEQAIADFGLQDAVTLLGVVPLEQVRQEMQDADVLLHAATSEGFCYVAIEAQAMELPVVTSDADGLPENVADGETGFVVPRRDPQALADKLGVVAADPALRRRLGENGRRRAITEFDPTRQIEQYEELYRRAADRAKQR